MLLSACTFYTDKEAMGYFRALTAKQEHSERVLDVTLRVIRLNPAHYTVWCASLL
jgi:protein farnesyltransferase/geranylgeranyltransferase type-1 subunit alpha